MKYILGVFAAILLVILVIVLIVRGFAGDGPRETGKSQVNLNDYSSQSATFTLTTYGPIVADEQRVTSVISVSPTARVLQVMQGYEQKVVFQQNLGNNTTAYQTFLQALSVAGYSNESRTKISDPTGVCPFGERFVYGLKNGSDQVINTWNTSCAPRQGSFGGDSTTVRKLFQRQIPNFQTLVNEAEAKINKS